MPGTPVYINKLQWSDDLLNTFRDRLQSDEFSGQLQVAHDLLSTDINAAVDTFFSCLRNAASCMERRIRVDKTQLKNNWFDKECKDVRSGVRKALRKFRSTRLADDRTIYVRMRK
ncbi:hypothetical protein BaRGS_00028542 [Batillaria attramentaria]|uniref:Uncharacterized protein n=1 Tax=Batillaria attramentaria TaxID=370345 RepID=A0ABD0JZU1_9CAEN